jgi:small redox-active disulfide protein 2
MYNIHMHIQVVGSGCTKCKQLHETVTHVAADLGIEEKVTYSDDITALAELGVMSSPAFVVDDEVIVAGKVPSQEEIKEALTSRTTPSTKQESDTCCGCCCGEKC